VGELRSDPPQATAQDDALHDEFFRQGEQIDKENVAAQAAAANWQPSEAPPHDKSIAPRWDPKLTERQRRLRHLVASVLAPAAILAAIAAAKHLDATSAASTGPVSPTSAELSAARLLAARASQHALSEDSTPSLSASEPATRDDQHAAAERDRRTVAAVATADAQQGKDLEGAAPAPTSSDVANTPAAADGVNTRKAAVRALNQGRWDDALSAAYAALAQEPTDATLYLYAGTALQEKGRGEEARKVFRTCLQQAKRGPIHECRVFAR
jgi:tetratricopeptide (TPR) repeat protein